MIKMDIDFHGQWSVWSVMWSLSLILAMLLMMQANGQDEHLMFQWMGQLMLLLLLLWVLLQSRQVRAVEHGRLPVALVALWLWMGLSVCWASAKTDAVLEWMAFSTVLQAVLISSRLSLVGSVRLQQAAVVLLLGMVGHTLYQGLGLGIQRPGGFFVNNSNSQGIVLVSLLLGVVAANLGRPQHSRGLGGLIVLAVMAICLQGGRGPLLVLLSLALVVMVLAHRMLRCSRQQLSWTAGCLGLGLLLGYGLNSELLLRLAGFAHEWHDAPGKLGSGRASLWMAAWYLYQDHALLGVGFNNYHLYYFQYADPQQVDVSAGNFVHNDYLQMLVELGPVGGLLTLAWLGHFAKISRRLLLAERTQVRFALPCLVGAWAILLHAGIDHNLTNEPLLMLLALMMGPCYQWYAQLTVQSQAGRKLGRGQGVLAAGYGMVLVYWIVAYSMAYNFERQPPQEPLLRVAGLQRLMTVMPLNDVYRANLAGYILHLIKQEPGTVNPEQQQQLLTYAGQQIDSALQLNSGQWQFLQIKAGVSEMLGQPQRATDYMQQALLKNPVQIKLRLEYARLLLSQHQPERAKVVLLNALGRKQIVSVSLLSTYCELIDKHWPTQPGWQKVSGDLRTTAAFYARDVAVLDKTFYLSMPEISARLV